MGLNWFKYRQFYGDIGRGLQVDRLAEKYSYLTPYQFASNSPIVNVEIDGLEGMNYLIPYLKENGGKIVDKILSYTDFDDVTVVVTNFTRSGNVRFFLLAARLFC